MGAGPSEPEAEPGEPGADRGGASPGAGGAAEVPAGPPRPPRRGTLAQLSASSSQSHRLLDQVPRTPRHLIRRGAPGLRV